MTAVLIVGVIASLAIPSFMSYARRARTSEAAQNLNVLYKSATALYQSERSMRGIASTVVMNCVAEPTTLTPAVPGTGKQKFVAVDGFLQLNFRIADFVYFGYGISSIGSPGIVTCFNNAINASVYTFYAHGDLNEDGVRSTFELAIGSDSAAQLHHSRGLYIVNEPE
jgi:type II secretory pathway pseudopilin PulG